MYWPKIGATHYHAQSGLPVKGCVIKELVYCYVVWLGSVKLGWVLGLVQGTLVLALDVVRTKTVVETNNNIIY